MDIHTFILILHVLGAGLLVGSSLSLVAVLMNIRPIANHVPVLRILQRAALYGILWQLLTGAHLATSEINGLIESPTFWVKMGLFLLDAWVVIWVLEKRIALLRSPEEDSRRQLLRWVWIAGSTSVALMIAGVLLFQGA